MSTGLSVSRIVNVAVNMSPTAAARRSFGILCLAGDSDVIDGLERLRTYTGIDGVGDDFGTDSPEYAAALIYFRQSPKPKTLMIGRWIAEATPAMLKGGTAVDVLATWTAIEDGAMAIEVDGVESALAALDFSGAASMSGVAAVISAALAGAGASGATCQWDGSRFVITTVSTGSTADMGYAAAPAAGTDISTLAGLTEALAYAPVPGYDAETPAQCAAELADMSSTWYGLVFASATAISNDQYLDVAAYIEASDLSRLFGGTITDARCLSSAFLTDLGTQLKAKGYDRTCTQYSSDNAHAVVSMIGRAFTVNFSGDKTTLTLKFKDEPGITAETLKESQATTLKGKNVNVFVYYENDTAIIQEGVMASGVFFDEIHGLDWLQNAVQTEVWNLLYQSKTKVPQTETGMSRIKARVISVLDQAVNNGLIAPGVWNSDGFGELEEGDYLPKGYYVYSSRIDDQSQSEREARVAPAIQCAVKLAGAIHFVDVTINVNR
ncbi:DUF3383 domain-containing protein [Pseudodesulfovibrio sp.]|uniref:DUF3383 domain-containing protein n=1 Tax=Pseudodesulfovibrio sp. TaxID=2035812 RepID=UPI00260B4F41|nr:DUF3383 domain-containing protein [Pseudodesulfovibrio sp.]MDD3310953.1 DUF3383 domain-containing protein [Pseudodesulfovibrio sp.]